jgi:sec-independent protein translocase protein TatA
MPNIGPMELAIVAIIALVVFGPKRLPELGNSLGKGFREFKSSISGEDEKPTGIDATHFEDDAAVEDDEPVATEVAEAELDTATRV